MNDLFLFQEFGDNCNPLESTHMGYVERNLAHGERIVYKTRLHWISLFWLLLLMLITYALFITRGYDAITQIFLALSLYTLLWVPLSHFISEFAVTNRRVISRAIRSRYNWDYNEVSLIEARNCDFRVGIFGRLFDYGTVVITDAKGGQHTFLSVPGEFYRQVEARLARIERILK